MFTRVETNDPILGSKYFVIPWKIFSSFVVVVMASGGFPSEDEDESDFSWSRDSVEDESEDEVDC